MIKLPRDEFDEFEKTEFINHLHSALLKFYDAVVYTDCDEFLVPDPERHARLKEYIATMSVDCVRAVGIDVLHIINHEFPLDLSKPILSQRQYGKFGSPSCKALISKVPLRWLPGFHTCDLKVGIDPALVMFHLKFMDYNIATQRQIVNVETVWSKRSLENKFGEHHRWDMKQFVHSGFLVPADVFNRNAYGEFDFADEISAFDANTALSNGYWYIPMNIHKYVKLPERFSQLL